MPEMPMSHCPNCKRKLDAATNIQDEELMPSPGDVTLCMYCGHIGVFDDRLQLRDPTDDEMYGLAGHPEVLLISKALKKARDQGKIPSGLNS